MTIEKKKVGRKPKWRAGETELIRVPKIFVEQILSYTHQLDNDQVPARPTSILVNASPVASDRAIATSSTDEIDCYRLLLEIKNSVAAIPITESAVERLVHVKTDLEQQIIEVKQIKQQNRESQRQIREKEDEFVILQQKYQNLDEKLAGLNLELEKLNQLIDSLKAENNKLRLFRSESGESELLVTEILGLIYDASSNAVKMYIKSIYSISQGEPIERVRTCLKVMARIKEGETIYNNCCLTAATKLLAGEKDAMTLEEIMKEVATDCDERRERRERY
jgi:vacuolar-type H+-ATPase subunit I/STV1